MYKDISLQGSLGQTILKNTSNKNTLPHAIRDSVYGLTQLHTTALLDARSTAAGCRLLTNRASNLKKLVGTAKIADEYNDLLLHSVNVESACMRQSNANSGLAQICCIRLLTLEALT